MQKQMMHYDANQDILYIVIRDGEEDHFEEIDEGVIVEFDEDNQPIGIEIFNALSIMRTVFKEGQLVVPA